MEYRNAAYNAQGTIDAEINHPVHGWLPTTLAPDDVATSEMHALALLSVPGAYVAPPAPTVAELLAAERAGMVVSRFQAKAALMAAGHLPAVEAAISAADAITNLAWVEAVEMRRTSPMIAGLAGAIGLTDTDLDDLFRAAALIEA